MSGRVDAVCVSGADLPSVPDRKPDRTGIDKRPVTGRVAVHPLGLDGDVQVNRKHHGGEGQAVYAYAQEDADFWIAELGRELPPGRFGENLRTTGLDLRNAVLGERWQVGTALFEVTAWRTPCANFARFWDVPDLVKRFAAHGATGAYLRVLETGEIGAGDAVEVVVPPRPRHHRRARPSGSPRPRSPGCPSSRRRCGTCRSRTSRSSRAQDRRTDRRARPEPGGALLSAAVRRELARPTGRSPCRCAAGASRCSRWPCSPVPCSPAAAAASIRGVGARPAGPRQDAPSTRPSSAHFVLDSEGAPDDRHRRWSAARATSPGRRRSRAR